MNDKKVCGTCEHGAYFAGEWRCNNPDSDVYGEFTFYNDSCVDWEARE